MKPKLATKVCLITVCKGESSVGYRIDCFADISTEERERRYSETRSRSVAHTHSERNK